MYTWVSKENDMLEMGENYLTLDFRPEPHAAAGRGVFDFLLPVSLIRLYFDFYSYVLINFVDFPYTLMIF